MLCTTSIAEELFDILTEEVALHQGLIRAAGVINLGVLKKDVDKVDAAMKIFDGLSIRVEELEALRHTCCRQFVEQIPALPATARIHQIAEHIPQPLRSKISELGATLKKTINELHYINTSNKILLEENLKGIAMRFDLAKTNARKFNNYTQFGSLNKGIPVDRHFVNRTA